MNNLTTSKPIKSLTVITAKKGIDLSILKISPSFLARKPHELYFPDGGLNSLARPVWVRLFHDPLFLSDLNAITDPAEAWTLTLQSFMDKCFKDGIDPFKSKNDPTVNNYVRECLYRRRFLLKSYLEVGRLFDYVELIPTTVKHRYYFMSTGNVRLEFSAKLRFKGKTKEDVEKLLKSAPLSMLRTATGFGKNLQMDLNVSVTKLTSAGCTLSHTIEIRKPFFMPSDLQKVRRHEFLDKEFMLPMIRGCRLVGVPYRVKF